MHSLRAVLLATLVFCGFAVAVPTAAAPTPTTPVDVSPNAFQNEGNASAPNGTLGAEISSFMQVSTSQTQGTIDAGLWTARFNNTKNKSAKKELVEHRVKSLQTRITDLRQRKQSLVEARKNGEISTLRYQAEMSELIGQIRSLEHAINTTKPRAAEVGTDVQKLQELDKQASDVGGPEVAAVARSLNSVKAPGKRNSTQTPGAGQGIGNGNGNNGGVPGVGNNTTVGTGNDSTVGNGTGNGSSGLPGVGNNSTISAGVGNDSNDIQGKNGSTLGNGTGTDGAENDSSFPSISDVPVVRSD
ncbi:DUF7096 domain-containing protein [Haladaptatus sp. NG-SE-30]